MKRLALSLLVRNVFAVASGTAAAQVVVFAFSPLITRIYSPETFGLQGVFLSLVGILSPVIALRYPMAIMTAETDDEALRLSRLSLMIAGGIATLLWLILLVGRQTVLQFLGAEGLGALILFLPLALIAVAFQDITDYRAARLGAFRLVGLVAVLQAFVTNLARVLGGLAAPVAATLVTITALAPALKAVMLRAGAHDLRRKVSDHTRVDAREILHRHRDFPLFRMPTDVLNAASQAVPVTMLAALYSPTAAGLYALTRSVLSLPSNIIGQAVGNVLYARFAEMSREGRPLLPLLLRATFALLALAPIIIGLAWFAPLVFAYVFGDEWREAGHYARWMALWTGIVLANVPAVRLAPVIRAQSLLLFANVLILAVRVAAIFGTAWAGASARDAVAAFSVVSLVANVALVLVIVRRSSMWDKSRFGASAETGGI